MGARASRFTTYSAGAARSLGLRPSVLSPLPHSQFRVVCAEQVAEKRRASRHPEPGSFEARDRHFMFASQCKFFGACWRLRMTTQPRFSANRESRVPRVPNRATRVVCPGSSVSRPCPQDCSLCTYVLHACPPHPPPGGPLSPKGARESEEYRCPRPLGEEGTARRRGPHALLVVGARGLELTIIRKSIYVSSIILNI